MSPADSEYKQENALICYKYCLQVENFNVLVLLFTFDDIQRKMEKNGLASEISIALLVTS